MAEDPKKAQEKADDDEVKALVAESAAEAVRTAKRTGDKDLQHAAVRGAVAEKERLLWKHGIGTAGQVRLREAVGRCDAIAAAAEGQKQAEQ